MLKQLNHLLVLAIIIVSQLVGIPSLLAQETPDYCPHCHCCEEAMINQSIPMLKSLKQISKNQLELTYDQDVDLTKATTATNYWVQSLNKAKPSGISTLGKNDKVNASNSLIPDKVTITQKDSSHQTFILTFKNDVSKDMEYKLIICYITIPNGSPYSGNNGSSTFVGQ